MYLSDGLYFSLFLHLLYKTFWMWSVAQTEKLTHACQNGFLKIALPFGKFWLLPQTLHQGAFGGTRVGPFGYQQASHRFEETVCKTVHANVSRQIRKCAFSGSPLKRGLFELRFQFGVKMCVSGRGLFGVCSCRGKRRCRRTEKWEKTSRGCTVQSSIK